MGYSEDLAYIHDAGFGHFARAAAPFLLKELRHRRLDDGLVIDLGCGSGILAQEVAAAGYDVLGIDQSDAMLELARRRLPSGQFRQASILDVDLPPCTAVCAIGEIFSFLFDTTNTRQRLLQLFRRAQGAICPGGIFVFDMAGPGRVPASGPRRDYREGKDWATLFTSTEDRRRRLLTREITSFRKVGELYRRHHEVHRLHLYAQADIAELLRRAGFRFRTIARYESFRFPPGLFGFLARRI